MKGGRIMPKELKFVMLLDCYGELLTEKQRNVMELYYFEDLSLSEIGEPLGITRQAILNLIKRTENILQNYENKLGFARRLEGLRACFNNITESADELSDDNINIKNKINSEVSKGLDLL